MPPARLGLVQIRVGLAQQRRGSADRLLALATYVQAHGDHRRHRRVGVFDLLVEYLLPELLCEFDRAAEVGVRQQADELFSAVARHQVPGRLRVALSVAATQRRQSSPA